MHACIRNLKLCIVRKLQSAYSTSRIVELQSVEDCLKYVNIEKLDNLNKVSQLKEEDLKEIGI